MKKVTALLLCITLLAGLGLSAAAAGDKGALNDRMTAVTLKVKETLGIGDSFTSFDGYLNEYGNQSLWSLTWSSDSEQIYVSANENGTIVSYSDNKRSYADSSFYGRIPRFPTMSLDEAKAIAGDFLSKVLDTKITSVNLEGASSLDYSGSAMYHLSGSLRLNGVETPIYISVSVSAALKQVVNYYRSDLGQNYSGAAHPSGATDSKAAAELLKSTLNMKMTYALPGDGTRTARLQYQPRPDGSYVVDATTGKLVDLSKLDWSVDEGGGTYSGKASAQAPEASAAADRAVITPAEQTAIDKLQGVMTQSALEKIVRSYPELGLTDEYVLQYVNYYSYDKDDKASVTANLQFTYSAQDQQSRYLSVTMDAKAGKLQSVNGYIPFVDTGSETPSCKYTDAETLNVAKSFAGKILPVELAKTVLSDSASTQSYPYNLRSYVFYRTHEDIEFPENYISVGVDADTGYVVNFYYNWYDYAVTFPSQAGAISADQAAQKYADAAGTALRYVSVPTADQPSGLLLAYSKADETVWGVNALTGEPLKTEKVQDSSIRYDDVEGNPYQSIIMKLAGFGIGFPGGKFMPNAQLTQLDALVLIESTTGLRVTPRHFTETDEINDVYLLAYSMGILTPDEKNPSKKISRAEFVKYLVNALGYKEIATLQDIYKPGFTDDKSIPAGLEGYMAIGKGLGIIKGDQNGYVRPNDIASRTMAAIMLYNCLNRK